MAPAGERVWAEAGQEQAWAGGRSLALNRHLCRRPLTSVCCERVLSIPEGGGKTPAPSAAPLLPARGDHRQPEGCPHLCSLRDPTLQEAALSWGPFSRSNVLFEEMCLLRTRPFQH